MGSFRDHVPWELSALTDQWRRLLRQELRERQPQGLRIAGKQTDFLIFDDSHHPRSGRHLEGAGYHWVRSHDRAEWSHAFVLGCYRPGDYAFAYRGDPYVRETEVAQLNQQREQENLPICAGNSRYSRASPASAVLAARGGRDAGHSLFTLTTRGHC